MAEDTSILQEIEDALRVDRAQEFWRRYGTSVLVCCGLIVASSVASVLWKNHIHGVQAEDTVLLAQAATATQAERYNEAIDFYAKVEENKGSLATLAAIHHAQALLSLKREDKALALYTDIAAGKFGDSKALCDYAGLQAAIMKHNLDPQSKKPPTANVAGVFALSGSELDALQSLQAGDTKTAKQMLERLVADEAAPFSERSRAAEILNSLKDGKK